MIEEIASDTPVPAPVPVTRCKMRVATVVQNMNENGLPDSETVTLQAVYGRGGSANEQWAKWTPSAQLNITISNPAAFGKLSKGSFFFCDFTPRGMDD